MSQTGSAEDANPVYLAEPPADSPEEVRARHEANRIAWNEGAAHYAAELEETIAFIRGGGSNLHPIERANLGSLRPWCHVAIHLQCASGRDTLSLWNEGAGRVVGVDISDVHIANARRLSEAVGAPATWYRCDVLDTPHELDGTADLVYTGRGALCWLHDLDGWAAVIHRLLKPGGVMHVLDGHPLAWLFDPDAETLAASGIDYFEHAEWNLGWPTSYIGDLGKPIEQHAVKHERLWTLSAVFAALHGAGLAIERFGEHPDDYWDSFPNLRPELRGRIPMTFSMVARRPFSPNNPTISPTELGEDSRREGKKATKWLFWYLTARAMCDKIALWRSKTVACIVEMKASCPKVKLQS